MSRYRNPAAIVQEQQPATDTQTTEQMDECCTADTGLQSNLRQTAGHASAWWDQSQYKYQDLEQPHKISHDDDDDDDGGGGGTGIAVKFKTFRIKFKKVKKKFKNK